MKKRKISVLLFLLTGALLLAPGVKAQNDQETAIPDVPEADSIPPPAFSENYEVPLFDRPSSIGLQLGSTGIGLSYNIGINTQWTVAAGFDIFPQMEKKNLFQTEGASLGLKGRTSNIHVWAEYAVLRHLNIVLGLSYFSCEAEGLVLSRKPVNYGDIKVGPENIGTLTTTVSWNTLAPYIGIGLLRKIPVRGFSVGMDLGTYYMGIPKVKVTGTDFLRNNEDFEKTLSGNLKGYRWWPVLQLSLNYRINPPKKAAAPTADDTTL